MYKMIWHYISNSGYYAIKPNQTQSITLLLFLLSSSSSSCADSTESFGSLTLFFPIIRRSWHVLLTPSVFAQC